MSEKQHATQIRCRANLDFNRFQGFLPGSTRGHISDHFSRNTPSAEREPDFVNEEGFVTVEYVVVLATVSLACAMALWAAGPALVRTFSAQVIWLLLPFS